MREICQEAGLLGLEKCPIKMSIEFSTRKRSETFKPLIAYSFPTESGRSSASERPDSALCMPFP